MKKSRFTEYQIIGILKEADAGLSIKEVCRQHGISQATFKRACRAVVLNRTTWYRRSIKIGGDDEVITALNMLVGRWPRCGFWKCFHWSRAQDHKRVWRIYCGTNNGRTTH